MRIKIIDEMKRVKTLIISCVATFILCQSAFAQDVAGKIILGCETSLLPSAVWIAENKGYFENEGLNVKIKEFSSGKTALSTMLHKNNLDMVTVAQTPVVFNSFIRNDYLIIAAMVYSDKDVKVLARGDKGIKKPSDLKGRKLGITKDSTGHFFLGVFLIYNDLGISDVNTVDLEASALPYALIDGRVDAISTWEPHISNAKKALGKKAVVLSKPGIFREDFYFVVNKGFVKNNSDNLKKFLKAIGKAEVFIQKNKSESIKIVSKRLKISYKITASIWNEFDFHLILDQSILISLEQEARWAIREGLVNKSSVPNYLNFIYMDTLKEVNPAAVTIIQ